MKCIINIIKYQKHEAVFINMHIKEKHSFKNVIKYYKNLFKL